MAQSALEQNPTSTLLTRALSMAPSVSVLTRFDCLDFQDLAGGGGGGGLKGLGPQQSCPLTFSFVPMGLNTWYTLMCFFACFLLL